MIIIVPADGSDDQIRIQHMYGMSTWQVEMRAFKNVNNFYPLYIVSCHEGHDIATITLLHFGLEQNQWP